ncbi:MAG: hypothetical protein U5N53_06620 [Mycobacterium sp.]|nr:hypothetical protein [Mycobacterium sp.]
MPNLFIAEDMGLPGWTFLGEQRDREVAFGAVGKFWQPTIEWRDVAVADFRGFAEPGWGKIAANPSPTGWPLPPTKPHGTTGRRDDAFCATGG